MSKKAVVLCSRSSDPLYVIVRSLMSIVDVSQEVTLSPTFNNLISNYFIKHLAVQSLFIECDIILSVDTNRVPFVSYVYSRTEQQSWSLYY